MDIKRHSTVYDELLKLNITLNFQDVPSPAYIQEKIIECSSFQIKAERFFIEVTRDLATAERLYKTEKLDFEMLKRSTLINNEKIKRIPTGKEREAAVDELLESNHKNLLKLENDVNDLQSILSAIKQKQSTLKSTNADIKSLARIMEQQIGRLNIGHPEDPDVKELAATFSEIDKMEEEFNLEDVESSTDIDQSEESETPSNLLEPEESVEIVIDESLEQSLSSSESKVSTESNVLGDKLDPEPQNTGSKSENSQSTKDIGKKSSIVSETPDNIAIDEGIKQSDSVGDIEDELASFLTDDDSEANQSEDENRDGEIAISVDNTSESVVEIASEGSPDISVVDDIDSDIESSVSVSPKVEIDLSDIGIDIDFGDGKDIPSSTPVKESLPTKETKLTNTAASIKTETPKKVDPPKQSKSVETKKTDSMDIDLLDILSSLD